MKHVERLGIIEISSYGIQDSLVKRVLTRIPPILNVYKIRFSEDYNYCPARAVPEQATLRMCAAPH